MPPYVRVPAHAVQAHLQTLSGRWRVVEGHKLELEARFPDFASALAFTNAVGVIAEEMNHHPDVHLSWGRVVLVIWTHAVNGLTESDFALAKRIDAMPAVPGAEG